MLRLRSSFAFAKLDPRSASQVLVREDVGGVFIYFDLDAPALDLCFLAISMKARAARLRALSLRKTRARSRRSWASAMGIAAKIPARTSSCTLEREMKPTPMPAATKRLRSSLESSPIL